MNQSKSQGKQGLSCSFKGCDFITKITNKSKAKKKVRQHEQTHKNIEMPENFWFCLVSRGSNSMS